MPHARVPTLAADGTVHEMGGQDHCVVGPGDVFVLRTPSGGGYGPPPASGEKPSES